MLLTHIQSAKAKLSCNDVNDLIKNNKKSGFILEMTLNDFLFHDTKTEKLKYAVDCFVDRTWEVIHTGCFNNVSDEIRKSHILATLLKVYSQIEGTLPENCYEKCSTLLDEAMLVGSCDILDTLCNDLICVISNVKVKAVQVDLPVIKPLERLKYSSDIMEILSPSVEEFNIKCVKANQPALLFNTIDHWPALHKWRDLNYIFQKAGNRIVPIEIGTNYTSNDWSQQLMKVGDFLKRQFLTPITPSNRRIEYLAQHDIFSQVPHLMDDIRIPSYCGVGALKSNVDARAWLGPKSTITPLHYDETHNLLCQVFGRKKIILAAPSDASNLYPHASKFLNNTSQINAENIAFEKFPLTKGVKFFTVILQKGDCLYIPPKWWHYVRSKTESFSVNFWWK